MAEGDYDIPDEFYDDAVNGELRGGELNNWLHNDAGEAEKEYFEEAFDNNLSAEWATILGSEGMSANPHDWDNVLIARDAEGDWTVSITEGGETATVAMPSDDVADDLIWADLYWHLRDEGVEFDKEIDS